MKLSVPWNGCSAVGVLVRRDLVKAGRSEAVYIVPIGIQYRYVKPPWRQLDWLLSQLEADSGLPCRIEQSATPDWEKLTIKGSCVRASPF